MWCLYQKDRALGNLSEKRTPFETGDYRRFQSLIKILIKVDANFPSIQRMAFRQNAYIPALLNTNVTLKQRLTSRNLIENVGNQTNLYVEFVFAEISAIYLNTICDMLGKQARIIIRIFIINKNVYTPSSIQHFLFRQIAQILFFPMQTLLTQKFASEVLLRNSRIRIQKSTDIGKLYVNAANIGADFYYDF